MAQQAPELLAGTGDVALHRADGQVQFLGDLVIRALLEDAQLQARSVRGSQPIQGVFDGGAPAGRAGDGCRGFGGVGHSDLNLI